MQPLIRLFIDIIMHRKGPQDVPAGGTVLGLALLFYLGVGVLVLWPTRASLHAVVGQLALDLLLVVTVFGGLLFASGRSARVGQTLAALFGTSALLSAAALPFVWLVARAFVDGAAVPGLELVGLLGSMALFMLLIAALLVTGHIVRHALDWSYAAGVLVAVAYFTLSVAAYRRFFPVE